MSITFHQHLVLNNPPHNTFKRWTTQNDDSYFIYRCCINFYFSSSYTVAVKTEIRHGLAEGAEQSRFILVISRLQIQYDPQCNLTKSSYWSLWLLHKHSSSLAFNFTEGNQVPELTRRCQKMKQRLPWSYRLAVQQRDAQVLSFVGSMIRNPQEWGRRASFADNSGWYDKR